MTMRQLESLKAGGHSFHPVFEVCGKCDIARQRYVTGSDISNYCVYENKTYSPGALTCDVSLKPSNLPQECQPPDASHKRAYWKLLDDKTVTCN